MSFREVLTLAKPLMVLKKSFKDSVPFFNLFFKFYLFQERE